MHIVKGVILAAPLALWGMTATAAGDAEAGKAVFEANCAECHYEDDFAGQSTEEIVTMINSVRGGGTEHKGDASGLSDEDVVNIATYWSSFK
jgi:mono/diheme cytochrome c family protein